MWRYIFWKTITSFLALIITAFLFYMLYAGIKGNPFKETQSILPADEYQDKLNQYGINDSILVRFFGWVKDAFTGSWGDVYTIAGKGKSVPELMFQPLRNSMKVMIPSFFIGMFLGLILGFVAGYNRGRKLDILINGFVTTFIAIPSFVLAAFALILGPIWGLPVIFQGDQGWPLMIRSIVMPILVMTLVSLASWTHLTRIEVSKILGSDYILAAKTRGFSGWTIFKKYVFRNALYPYAGSLATSFMIVFGSSLIVEKFFNVDGTSTLLLSASKAGELNILMFNLVFFLSLGLFTRVISDVAQFSINPIVRSNFSSKVSPFTKLKYKISRELKNKKNDKNDITKIINSKGEK